MKTPRAKSKFRKGQLCPGCKKGKLEKPDYCKSKQCKKHKHLHCKTCKWSNF